MPSGVWRMRVTGRRPSQRGVEGKAFLELYLGFGGGVEVAELDQAQGFSARSCEAYARGGEKGAGRSPW